MGERITMGAERDIAVMATELAGAISRLTADRLAILELRRSGDVTREPHEWIGYQVSHQDNHIAALCDALAALLRKKTP